jgi:hypothetical protein
MEPSRHPEDQAMTTARAESAAHDLMHKMFAHVAGLHPWTPCPVCEEIFESALLAERRRVIEDIAKIASEKREACLALREAAARRDPVAFAWHGAQAQAFHEAAHAISSIASPREET